VVLVKWIEVDDRRMDLSGF